ncbi:regulatory protein RecX [Aegicerativicinus sediminis]|uniref:regulatory protein RecX n=1 Tax=Aegicerativicinus sediminis TaxID=2893202 RepID=UPI001E571DC8|nr:regulatory protein RecX [Aegicerativicinus sediminis]
MIQVKTYTVEEAKRKMEHYCAYQERCHKEVREKLIKMRMIPNVIDLIITHLINENYLNEQRFANTYVLGKFRIKKWGKFRLAQELKKRELSKYTINKALSNISEKEYFETFDELAEKKFNSLRSTNKPTDRKKLADYLLYRGWEPQFVYDKVADLFSAK